MKSKKRPRAQTAPDRVAPSLVEVESRSRFQSLITSLQEELKPETAIEDLLTHKMAVTHWRLMRVWAWNAPAPPRESRFDRQFTRALDRFETFRATRTRHVQQTTAPQVEQ